MDDDWDDDEMPINHDINDVKPTSINHIIGQRSVVEQVKVALDSAQQDGRKFDHALCLGGPGLGKTNIAQVIGQEMGTDYFEVLGQSIKNVADLNSLLLSVTERSVVAIDEAHELFKPLQTTLYLALDRQRVIIPGTHRGSTPITVPIADFSLLLCTTDEYQLLQPLRERMRLVLRFEFYSVEELVQILHHRLKALQWEVDEEVLPLIASRSKGVPRLALRLAQAARRVCRAVGEDRITLPHLERACVLEEIDSLGLGRQEQKYLSILLGNGPTRLNVLASMLALPSRTVAQVIEPFLLRAGLIVKDDQGKRCLTAQGREHLETQKKNRV